MRPACTTPEHGPSLRVGSFFSAQFKTIASRRDQEEGGELDSHKEASPEKTKSGEVMLG